MKHRFSFKQPNITENSILNIIEHFSQFSDKNKEKTHCLKLEFYSTDRKLKNIISYFHFKNHASKFLALPSKK